MKGKTVKRKNKMPRQDDVSEIPPSIIKEYSDVHLSIDVMHVNGIKFLIYHTPNTSAYYRPIVLGRTIEKQYLNVF
jgi:hypothetical protein